MTRFAWGFLYPTNVRNGRKRTFDFVDFGASERPLWRKADIHCAEPISALRCINSKELPGNGLRVDVMGVG